MNKNNKGEGENEMGKNEIMNIDNMSTDQLIALQEKIVLKRMSDIQERLERMESNQAYYNKQSELKYSELKDDVGELKEGQDKLHILAVEPAKLNELRNAIKKRVTHHTNGIKSNKYKLFAKLFFDKCGGHLKHSLNVPRYDSIRIEDFEIALTIVNRWTPMQKHIQEKIQEYIKLDDEGCLPKDKKLALDSYLEETQGGKYAI